MISGTTQVTSPIAPTSVIDLYPTHDNIYGQDGLRNVLTTLDRNAIPNLRRRAGMLVGVLADDSYWRLKNVVWDGTNNDWEPFILGTSNTFSNGLTENLGNVKLGGALIENTNIDGAYNLLLGTITPLTFFSVYTSDTINNGIFEVGPTYSVLGSSSSTQGSEIALDLSYAYLSSYDNTGTYLPNSLFIHNQPQVVANNGINNTIIFEDQITSKGAVYALDYSANFTLESLVTKRWTESLVANYVPLSQKGLANGVATLDGSGKIPVSQLASSVMQYQGQYNATTNTPSLINGTGDTGDVYEVIVAGTHDFGAGNITFNIGDWVVYNGTIWEKSINSNEVVSVNGFSGAVNLTTTNISEGTNLYYTDVRVGTYISGLGLLAGTIANTQIAFGNASSAITGSNLFTYDGTNVALGLLAATSKLHIKGVDSTSSNYGLKIDNLSGNLFAIRNDSYLYANMPAGIDLIANDATTNLGAVGGSLTRVKIQGGAGALLKIQNVGYSEAPYYFAGSQGGASYEHVIYEELTTGSSNAVYPNYGKNIIIKDRRPDLGVRVDSVIAILVRKDPANTNTLLRYSSANFSDGYVSIGYDLNYIPTSQLDVSASGSGTVALNLNTSSTQDSKLHFRTNNAATARAQLYVQDSNQTFNLYTLNSDTIFWNGNGLAQVKTLTLFTDTTAKFENNVGIGINPSGYKLHISSISSSVLKTEAIGTDNNTIFTSDYYTASLSLNSYTSGQIGSGGSNISLNNNGLTRGSLAINTSTSVFNISSSNGYWLLLSNGTTESIGLGQGGNYIGFNTNGVNKMLLSGATGALNIVTGNTTIGALVGAPSFAAMYMNVTPNTNNYVLASNGTTLIVNGQSEILYAINNSTKATMDVNKFNVLQPMSVGSIIPSGPQQFAVNGLSYFKGTTNSSSDYSIIVENLALTQLFTVRNDGDVRVSQDPIFPLSVATKQYVDNSLSATGIVDITRAALITLKSTSALVKGVTYRITDRYTGYSFGDDRGYVYVKALSNNELAKEAIRIMACPSYYNTGVAFTYTWIGVWHSSKTVNINDYAIYGGRVYKNLTGSIGTSSDEVTLDAVNWVQIAKSNSLSRYEDIQFNVIYDFNNDWFEQQTDGSGNVVGIDYYTYTDFGLNYNPCDITDWNFVAGRNTGIAYFYENKIPLGIYNNTGTTISNNTGNSDCAIYNNTSDSIYNNKATNISGNTCANIAFNTIGQILNNANTGNISYNSTGMMYQIAGNSSNVVNIIFNTNKGNININDNIGSIEYNDDTILDILNLPSTITKVSKNQLYNDVISGNDVYTIDITGLTTLDLGTNSELLKNVVLISSNSSESIDTILNMPPDIKPILEPKFGLIVNFIHGTGANQPRIEGGANTYVNGSYSEWIEFEISKLNVIRQFNIATYI